MNNKRVSPRYLKQSAANLLKNYPKLTRQNHPNFKKNIIIFRNNYNKINNKINKMKTNTTNQMKILMIFPKNMTIKFQMIIIRCQMGMTDGCWILGIK